MRTYMITDWNYHFEKADTRRCRTMMWVPVPNKHDGLGYRKIMAHPKAAEIFTAWILMLQVASKCPKRGVLADENGPLSAKDLAIKTGFKADAFELAFKVLSSRDIGWLTSTTGSEMVADW